MNTTTNTPQTTVFVNLFKAIKAEQAQRMLEFITRVNEETNIETLRSPYHFCGGLIPAGRKHSLWTLEGLREYLIAREIKANGKYLAERLTHLQNVEAAADMVSINVSVEWKKSRMWGNNPQAEATVCYTDHSCNTFKSSSIGGCGYDKESTAIAEALNQSNSFLKSLYTVKEKNADKNNRDLFGYGSGYGILPHLEGGESLRCLYGYQIVM